MIGTILRSQWLHLKRDYVALGLTFVLPIVFFTIFGAIFGSMGGGDGLEPMRIIIVDRDQSEISRRFVAELGNQQALDVRVTPPATAGSPQPEPYTRESALQRVRSGHISAAVVLPAGFGETYGQFAGESEPVEIIYDAANPLAQHVVGGLLQATAFRAAPDILMQKGVGYLAQFGGGLTSDQQQAIDRILPYMRGEKPWNELRGEPRAAAQPGAGPGSLRGGPDSLLPEQDARLDDSGSEEASATEAELTGLVRIRATDARAAGEITEEPTPSIVAYYAAGIGVMFLLFSMAGAGGSLLEEEEGGALERVLTTSTSMMTLLLGKWIFFGLMGLLQVTIMFLWGALVFGLDLFTTNHLVGFLVMTLVTAAAASGFGILLAAACRSRAQLGGISTVVILVMSALGGSMVPRFVMPAFMKTTSLFTFNGWALDGYLKVFWYEDPQAGLGAALVNLLPQLLVLGGLAVLFLIAARLLARRWETV